MKVQEILPGIYRIEQYLGPRYLFQYLLVGQQALLIDTGIASSPSEVIFPAYQQVGLPIERLTTVLITHADVDHCGGNAAIKRLFPHAALIAHAADQPWLESKERILAERYGWYASYDVDYDAETKTWLRDNLGADTRLDRTVGESEVLDLGDRQFQVLHLPGHSPGHIGLWEPETRTALVSDAVLERGLYDISGKRIGPPPYFNVAQYNATIERLIALKPAHLLTAHYPDKHGEDVNKFLQESRTFVQDLQRAVHTILTETEGPVTLRTLTARADERVGPYASFKNELAGSVRAHVEALVAEGEVQAVEVQGLPAWRLIV